MDVAIISGDCPGLLDGHSLLISETQCAAMDVDGLEVVHLDELLDSWELPIGAISGPFDADFASVPVAFRCRAP